MAQQLYETMYILRPDLNEEQVNATIDKYRNFLVESGVEEVEIKLMGRRRLAYEIDRFRDGIYVLMNYAALGNHVAPMQRTMRLSEEVIRYLTLKVEPPKPVKEPYVAPEAVAVEA
ncbi:MAG: 30S ribosomal protein S6 [Coleofasciculaceae cyanobacterium SM2_1_6]|nr:30S ribosomal protein S6 [Coleofasciculaceae cyanobacterium SM2_1_6]